MLANERLRVLYDSATRGALRTLQGPARMICRTQGDIALRKNPFEHTMGKRVLKSVS